MTTSIDFLVVLGTTIILPFLVEYLKLHFKLEGKQAYAVIAVLLAIVYVIFTQIFPKDQQDKIWAVVGSVAYFAHLIYEFLIKKKTITDLVSDGGRDDPDPRDYVYEEVFGGVETVKKVVFPKDILIVQNQ